MPVDADLFKRALNMAATTHGDQKVPGSGLPYVEHLTKVAVEVLLATEGDSDLDRDLAVACALLHDTVEDAATREQGETIANSIRRTFGDRVADGVLALTKEQRLPKEERMADSVRRIRQQPREVWLVKLADRITNLEPPPPDWALEKRRAYLKEAARILQELGEANARLRRRLEQKLVEYAAHCG